MRLGTGHCCVCSQVCGHVGGPWFCARHEPSAQPTPNVVPLCLPVEKHERPPLAHIGDKPCPSTVTAVLGFPAPTTIPCGLIEGHQGSHSYTIEWRGEA